MSVTIKVDPFSAALQYQREREILDPKNTRIVFVDADTPLVPVPGCLKIDAIRMPGLLHENYRLDQVPVDTNERPTLQAIERLSYGIVNGLDGRPMLARGPQCDFGMWRKGTHLYITGEWDEAVSPSLDGLIPVPEVASRRVGVEVGGPAESMGRGRRAEPKE